MKTALKIHHPEHGLIASCAFYEAAALLLAANPEGTTAKMDGRILYKNGRDPAITFDMCTWHDAANLMRKRVNDNNREDLQKQLDHATDKVAAADFIRSCGFAVKLGRVL